MRLKVNLSTIKNKFLHKIILILLILTSELSFGASPGARKALGNPNEFTVTRLTSTQHSIRTVGWDLGVSFFSPHSVKHLGNLAKPEVPEFLTWFPINEVIRLMNQGFSALNIDQQQLQRKLSLEKLNELFQWNTNLVGKLPNWTESRFLIWQNQFTRTEHLYSLNELSRVLLNPTAVGHILNQSIYSQDCLKHQDSFLDVMFGMQEGNRSPCFSEEFPLGSVIAKLNWTNLDEPSFKTYRTHPEELEAFVQNDHTEWDNLSLLINAPPSEEILTAELPSGKRFALTGIHFMVKNQADWTWITFWWSPEGLSSFNNDQPLNFRQTNSQARNYSQCTVISDRMNAPLNSNDSKQWIGKLSDTESNRESWCSNPYIEHGAGNIGTNCIGCHQFAGSNTTEESALKNSQKKIIRNNFPSDYVWSFSNGPQAWSRQFIIRLPPHINQIRSR